MEFLAQIVQFWQVLKEKVKASLPAACVEALDKATGGAGDHEMAAYSGEPGQQQAGMEAEYDEATGEFINKPVQQKPNTEEFDEFGGAKLTEWQAGWNVTNAIQVSHC